MYTLKSVFDQKSPDGTGYNDPPKGLRRISAKKFAQSNFFSYSPDFIETRQILVRGEKDLVRDEDYRKNNVMLQMNLYWYYDGTGIGIVGDFWGGKIRYYAFGCDHDYKDLTGFIAPDYHLHTYKCSKCGYEMTVDSSD